jgi:PAS domain S-box-containing protein
VTLDFAASAIVVALVAFVSSRLAWGARRTAGLREQQERLLRSEAALREAQRVARLGSWEWDAASDTFTGSEEMARLIGRDAMASDLRERLRRLLTPESAERLERAIGAALREGTPYELDVEMPTPEGASRWFVDRGEPRRNSQGTIDGLRGTFQEITERKRAEQALARSQQRYRTLVDHLPQRVLLKDRDGTFVSVNKTFARLVRRAPAEVIGLTAHDLLARPLADRMRGDDLRIMASGAMEEFDLEMAAHGRRAIVHIIKVPVRDDRGEIAGVLGISWDITDQRRIEAALAREKELADAMLNAMPGVLCLVDRDWRPIHWNPRLEEVTGYSTEEIARLTALDFYDESARPAIAAGLRQAFEGGRAEAESDLLTRNGARVPHYVNAVRVQIADRPHVLAVGIDIRARKEAEAALRRKDEDLTAQQRLAYERLQALSRRLLEIQETERRQRARELHDERGQVLTAAKIQLQSLERYPDPSSLATGLRDAAETIERALGEVRSLSLELRPPLLDDLGLRAALRWLLDQQAKRCGIRVRLVSRHLRDRFDAAIETACFRIAQEALNNAVKHAHADGVTFELLEMDRMLHLHARDDGEGFDVAAARARAQDGASLGLIGMEERAALAGGGIEWTSGPGRGTAVHAWFPLTEERIA